MLYDRYLVIVYYTDGTVGENIRHSMDDCMLIVRKINFNNIHKVEVFEISKRLLFTTTKGDN